MQRYASKDNFCEERFLFFQSQDFVSNGWSLARLDWRQFIPDYIPDEEIIEFLEDKNLKFLSSDSSSQQPPASKASSGSNSGNAGGNTAKYLKSFESHLGDLLQKAKVPEIFDMIQRELLKYVETPEFIELLTRAVCKSCLTSDNKFNDKKFTDKKHLLERYINQDKLMMFHCLLAVQNLVTDYQHPPGMCFH